MFGKCHTASSASQTLLGIWGFGAVLARTPPGCLRQVDCSRAFMSHSHQLCCVVWRGVVPHGFPFGSRRWLAAMVAGSLGQFINVRSLDTRE